MAYFFAPHDIFLSTLSLRRATYGWSWYDDFTEFLSTLSLRRATRVRAHSAGFNIISIHALLAESDQPPHRHDCHQSHFYPRSPCGERRHFAGPVPTYIIFLSTLSLRRATGLILKISTTGLFLSTLSLRRATSRYVDRVAIYHNFYPRSPCGERHIT